jgi:hypothetical protein
MMMMMLLTMMMMKMVAVMKIMMILMNIMIFIDIEDYDKQQIYEGLRWIGRSCSGQRDSGKG